MSVARVTDNGIEIEYTDTRSGITVLHRISEKEGEPVVEDYYKGKDGKLTKQIEDEPAGDPESGAEHEPGTGTGETVRVLGFKFKRSAE